MTRRAGVYWPGIALCVVVLLLSLGAIGWVASDWVAHHRGTPRAATVTEVERSGFRTDSNRLDLTVTFEMADGRTDTEEVRTRLFWHPSEGDALTVRESDSGALTIQDEFSYVRMGLVVAFALLPWVLLWLVVEHRRGEGTRREARRAARQEKRRTQA